MPYSHIPRGEELITIFGIMIPETGPIETCRENVQYSDINFWPNIVKFLTVSIQLSNKLAPFKSTIHLHSVVTLQCIPQMLVTGYPLKRISIEKPGETCLTGFLEKMISLVLDLFGSMLVLNLRFFFLANCSHVCIIFCSPDLLVDRSIKSSA